MQWGSLLYPQGCECLSPLMSPSSPICSGHGRGPPKQNCFEICWVSFFFQFCNLVSSSPGRDTFSLMLGWDSRTVSLYVEALLPFQHAVTGFALIYESHFCLSVCYTHRHKHNFTDTYTAPPNLASIVPFPQVCQTYLHISELQQWTGLEFLPFNSWVLWKSQNSSS